MPAEGSTIKLEITGMTHDGCAIGEFEGLKVFVVGYDYVIRLSKKHVSNKIEFTSNAATARFPPDCFLFLDTNTTLCYYVVVLNITM